MVFLGKPPICGLDHLVLRLRIDLEDLVRIHRAGRLADVTGSSDAHRAAVTAAPTAVPAGVRQRWRITYRREPVVADRVGRPAIESWAACLAESGLPVAGLDAGGGRARFAVGAPLPAGAGGEAELLEIWLTERLPAWWVRERLEPVLPEDHGWVAAEDVWLGAPSLPGQVAAADWRIELASPRPSSPELGRLVTAARSLLASASIPRVRMKGTTEKRYDLRPLVADLRVEPGPRPAVVARTRFDAELGAGRPDEVIAALSDAAGTPVEIGTMTRIRLILADDIGTADSAPRD